MDFHPIRRTLFDRICLNDYDSLRGLLVKQKSSLYIYERREVIILGLLSILLLAFAFTFGVHLGKFVGIKTFTLNHFKSGSGPVKTQNDLIPSGPELTEQGRIAPKALDDTMEQSLHDEVKGTGIKLKEPRQVELPTRTKAPQSGATTLEHKF